MISGSCWLGITGISVVDKDLAWKHCQQILDSFPEQAYMIIKCFCDKKNKLSLHISFASTVKLCQSEASLSRALVTLKVPLFGSILKTFAPSLLLSIEYLREKSRRHTLSRLFSGQTKHCDTTGRLIRQTAHFFCNLLTDIQLRSYTHTRVWHKHNNTATKQSISHRWQRKTFAHVLIEFHFLIWPQPFSLFFQKWVNIIFKEE